MGGTSHSEEKRPSDCDHDEDKALTRSGRLLAQLVAEEAAREGCLCSVSNHVPHHDLKPGTLRSQAFYHRRDSGTAPENYSECARLVGSATTEGFDPSFGEAQETQHSSDDDNTSMTCM